MTPKVHTAETLIVWIRRELRINDHLALWCAVHDAKNVVPVFIVDAHFSRASSARQKVIIEGLHDLRASLRAAGGELFIRTGAPEAVLHDLLRQTNAAGVYVTKDYHPDVRRMDRSLKSSVVRMGKEWKEFTDHVLVDEEVVASRSRRTPLTVFTAYKRAWREQEMNIAPPLPPIRHVASPQIPSGEIPRFGRLHRGTDAGAFPHGGETRGIRGLRNFLDRALPAYQDQRDFPGLDATSRLSHHLATGSLSIRTAYHTLRERAAELRGLRRQGPDAFLNELIWREFYYHILAHFPHVVSGSFKPRYDDLSWSYNTVHFEAWSNGMTGYPIVDAAMRQLNTEGFMHNRTRMIVASFLTKDLHIHWSKGEEYFMDHLADGDVALNNGGWQWCAGTGNDAQPWFRIFNPLLQSKKFDPDGTYIKTYLPELRNVPRKYIHAPWLMPRADQDQSECRIGREYPSPIVDHEQERKLALQLYNKVTKTR